MKRRNFVWSALAMGTFPLVARENLAGSALQQAKELYEIRTYDIKFRGNRKLLEDYLGNILKPALKAKGVNHFMTFNEFGMSDPPKIWVLISYPSVAVFTSAQELHKDPGYIIAAREYNGLGPDQALYTRYTSSLLLAFDGMTQMKEPADSASVFELRTYEGYSEDAVQRKIRMFNEGEIDLFLETGLKPVFFGEMLIGPYKPCLTYMLHFRDMEERNANWEQFVAHPGWKELSMMEEYANTVSNIRRTFLTPMG